MGVQLIERHIRQRKELGWHSVKAKTEPVRKKERLMTTEEIATARANGISNQTANKRIRNGWDRQEAISKPVDKRKATRGEIEL